MAKESTVKTELTLVVVHAFGDYRRGDRISDPAKIDEVLASENAQHCHKVIPQ